MVAHLPRPCPSLHAVLGVLPFAMAASGSHAEVGIFEGNLEDKQGFKRWRAGPWAWEDTFQAEGLAQRPPCEEGGWRLGTR